MVAAKEKAVEMIKHMPDDSMELIITMLEALEEYTGSDEKKRAGKRDAFFSAAGNINIDSDAVLNLRKESMV